MQSEWWTQKFGPLTTRHVNQISNNIRVNNHLIPKDLQYLVEMNKLYYNNNQNSTTNTNIVHIVTDKHPDFNEIDDWHLIRTNKNVQKRNLLQIITNQKLTIENTLYENEKKERIDKKLKNKLIKYGRSYEQDTQPANTSHNQPTQPIGYELYQQDIKYTLCKFTELFLSNEIKHSLVNIVWELSAYKDLNKITSIEQAKICQHLAMVLHLNPPEGFAKISEWSLPINNNIYDNPDDENIG